jgi:hypothetical protein
MKEPSYLEDVIGPMILIALFGFCCFMAGVAIHLEPVTRKVNLERGAGTTGKLFDRDKFVKAIKKGWENRKKD